MRDSVFFYILRSARPRQWLKNLSIYAAALFWGNLFEPPPHAFSTFFLVSKAVILFCMVSSATYLINDVVDAPKDRVHPIKKDRPIAKRLLSENAALLVALGLAVSAVLLSFKIFNIFFTGSLIAFFVLQLAYSFYLRNVIILDALTVATGFVLRVFAGTFAASAPVSSWLILSTIGLSLLLAFGKRRSERTILEAKNIPLETRETLKHYPDNLLDSMISMSASFAVVSYSLFTFQASHSFTANPIAESLLPDTLSSPKLMMLTIPIIIYGVARYLYVIYEKKEGESPERVLLSDTPLLNTVLLWSISILFIVYGSQIS